MYYVGVTVTSNLTSDLVFRTIMSEAYLLYYLCECILGWRSVLFHFQVTLTLTSDLFSRMCIESGAYLLYSLR